MCGIVGYLGKQDALPILLGALEKLEYRGYDSAGVAVLRDGQLSVTRSVGKLRELRQKIEHPEVPLPATIGIGHTRWATHGRPTEANAHPHTVGRATVIHNGIIENYLPLRRELSAAGRVFASETDTEIVAHLLDRELQEGYPPLEALRRSCQQIRGSYALLALDAGNADRILLAKNATPLVIGLGQDETILASDIPAVLDRTKSIMILEDGDLAEITADGIRIEDAAGAPVTRPVQIVTWDSESAEKGGYRHFMLKEIHEQRDAVRNALLGRTASEQSEHLIELAELSLPSERIREIERIVLVACGTAWHASLIAKFYFEALCRVPCEVDYASEFRYRGPVLNERTLVIAVSQSGETADTLAAVREAKGAGVATAAICNVLGSSIPRAVDMTLYTHAGPEISVASTKAFTTQVVTAFVLALALAERRGSIQREEALRHRASLLQLPSVIGETLQCEQQVRAIAHRFQDMSNALYLGRGACYPLALEGALKLKEISYVHAEGYPAGEMKHGPIALVDRNTPVVVVLNHSPSLYDKTMSNLREVESREGPIVAVTDAAVPDDLRDLAEEIIEVPFLDELLSPVVLAIPLQLFAYYVALARGTDVDLPRNLAKSVTVE